MNSKDLRELVYSMLVVNPSKRPSIEDILLRPCCMDRLKRLYPAYANTLLPYHVPTPGIPGLPSSHPTSMTTAASSSTSSSTGSSVSPAPVSVPSSSTSSSSSSIPSATPSPHQPRHHSTPSTPRKNMLRHHYSVDRRQVKPSRLSSDSRDSLHSQNPPKLTNSSSSHNSLHSSDSYNSLHSMNPSKNEVVIRTPRPVHNSAAESDLDEEKSIVSTPRRRSLPGSVHHGVRPVIRRISVGEPSSTHQATSPSKSPVKPRSVDLSYGSRRKPKPVTRAYITPIRRESPASSVEEAPHPVYHPQRVKSSRVQPLPFHCRSSPDTVNEKGMVRVGDDRSPHPLRQEKRQERMIVVQQHISRERDGGSRNSGQEESKNTDRQYSNHFSPFPPTPLPSLVIPTRKELQDVRQRPYSNDDLMERHRRGLQELRDAYHVMKNKK